MSVSYPRAARHCQRPGIRALPLTLPSGPPPLPRPVTPPDPTALAVDRERRTARAGGRPLHLTKVEFDLLAQLLDHPLRVFTRGRLLESVWGVPAFGDGRTVDVHVTRVRRKLGPGYREQIVTVRGVGYTYDPAR
ncbi:winged helix-turn-helix domain-containing protein [Streptacidiphilus rugosus]|uniref:winged helix-turn-helix domain-containing protein n=1 Tax=Streptacidiphilus rugosus TaxID=405783 RepID=UPI000690AA38|nr:winged helix-turn-helix domain-containing protein [Streptacidiphilus rugosus]